jgi:pyruvyltransferase
MDFYKKTRLFWWNEKIIQDKTKENFGDVLGQYLVEKISGKEVVFAWPKKFSVLDYFVPIYVTIGSVLSNVNHKCIVWGSGIISLDIPIKNAKFLAVRGPQTRRFLLHLGYEVPEIYGDPALLLPRYYNPNITKKFAYGIAPHYNDWEKVSLWFNNRNDILIIDMMTNDIESKTNEFLQCERILSSSLHGVIIAHAYGIPAVWQKFSDKVFGDDIKYKDYLESVNLKFYQPEIKEAMYSDSEMNQLFQDLQNLPEAKILESLQDGLMRVCPF